jgi:hypothetical protein
MEFQIIRDPTDVETIAVEMIRELNDYAACMAEGARVSSLARVLTLPSTRSCSDGR